MPETAVDTAIELLPVSRRHKEALAESRERLAASLGLRVPEGWPEFPEAFDPAHHRESNDWPGYFFVSTLHRAIVGNGGFTGPPVDGEVEVGYEVAPEFRNRGFATRALGILIDQAFGAGSIRSVIAHTLAERNASNAVLAKAGMTLVAELPNDEVGRVWRWRIQRPEAGGGGTEGWSRDRSPSQHGPSA